MTKYKFYNLFIDGTGIRTFISHAKVQAEVKSARNIAGMSADRIVVIGYTSYQDAKKGLLNGVNWVRDYQPPLF